MTIKRNAVTPSAQFQGQSVTFSTTLSVKMGATGVTNGNAGCYFAPAGWTQESQKVKNLYTNNTFYYVMYFMLFYSCLC